MSEKFIASDVADERCIVMTAKNRTVIAYRMETGDRMQTGDRMMDAERLVGLFANVVQKQRAIPHLRFVKKIDFKI